MKAIVCIAVVLAAAYPSLGADGIAWGSAVNGVRLGITFDTDPPEPELRVLLENSGTAMQEIYIGHLVGKNTALELRFVAASPDRKEREGFEINTFTPIAGLVLPAVVRLDPGVIHQLRIPLTKIVCVEKPGDITFDALVKQGYSVRVSLETDEKSAQWAGLAHAWIGKATSGTLGLQAN